MEIIPVEGLDGYYSIPEYPGLTVTQDGRVYDLKYDEVLPLRFYEYPAVNPKGRGTIHLHVLLANAFVDGKTEERNMVNHIDGNKLNYSIDNLEWVSASENCLHAYMTGLREDNTPIEVLDLRTKEIITFYSLQATARYFKVSGESIHRYLNSDKTYPYKKHFTMRYQKKPWHNVDNIKIGGRVPGLAVEIVAIKEDSIRIYSSLAAAADEIGVSRPYISKVLTNQFYKEKPIFGWTFYYLNDFIEDSKRACRLNDLRSMSSNSAGTAT